MGPVFPPSIQAYPKRKDTVLRQMARPVPIFDIYWALQLQLGFNRGVLTAVQLILTAVQ